MSRLDLLKPGTSTKSDKPTKPSGRGGMLGEKKDHPRRRKDDYKEDNLHLEDDDFQNELDDSIVPEYDIDNNEESNEKVNVIELDIDLNNYKELDIESDLLVEDADDEDIEETNTLELDSISEETSNDAKDENPDRVEGKIIQDYSEDDIIAEVEYSFEHREEAYNKYVKIIQDGGLVVAVSKVLKLGNILRVSITLTELKEQVGCEGRVVSVFPRNIRANEDENQNRYIVQFIGPNASETDRVLSKYLLGYKGK